MWFICPILLKTLKVIKKHFKRYRRKENRMFGNLREQKNHFCFWRGQEKKQTHPD
jgi:hypothetical protein